MFKTIDAAEWQEHLDAYSSAIATVGAARKKEKDLVKWNAFMSAGLPQKAREEGKLSRRDMQVAKKIQNTILHLAFTGPN